MFFKKYIRFVLFTLCISPGFNVSAQGQETRKVLTGNVYSAQTNKALGGMRVTIPGKSSTITSDSGTFKLKIDDLNITIIVEGIGYQTKFMSLNGKDQLEIYLNDENLKSVYDNIESVTGIKSAALFSNAQEAVKGGLINTSVAVNDFLMGKVTGLNSIARSGDPGMGSNMFIRGYHTLLTNAQPLVVVDGVIYNTDDYSDSYIAGNLNSNQLLHIDVKDIDNITVLKDATSIYGSKAANGVILINTIKPDQTVTHIDFYSRGGINFSPGQLPMMEGGDYRSYITNQLLTLGETSGSVNNLPFINPAPGSDEYYRYNNNTNWQDEVYGNSHEQNYYLRVTGGDEIAKLGVSVGYLNRNGIIKNTGLDRYSMRLNTNVSVTGKLNIFANLAFTVSEKEYKGSGILDYKSATYLALAKGPLFAPYINNELGTTPNLEDIDPLDISNPEALVNGMDGDLQDKRFFGTIGFNYKLYKGITAESLFNINFNEERENFFMPDYGMVVTYLPNGVGRNTVFSMVDRLFGLYNDTKIKYKNKRNPYHNINAVAGFRYSVSSAEIDWGVGYNTPSDEVRNLDSGSDDLRRTGGKSARFKDAAYYAVADYSFLNKYFVSASMSLDGSSRYGSEADGIGLFNGKFGLFPSVSLGWLASSENFMSSFNFIELLKIRASYGVTGLNHLAPYSGTKYYNSQRYIGVVGFVYGDIPNQAIQWETVKKSNIGIDLSILNEKINLHADIFSHQTEDMITVSPISYLSGKEYYMANDGAMENKGYEVGGNSRIINRSLVWDAGIGIARYKNEVTGLMLDQMLFEFGNVSTVAKEGLASGAFYGYKTNGVYTSDAEAGASGIQNKLNTGEVVDFRGGDVIYVNADNSNNIIDEDDRVVIGDPNPDFTGFISNMVSYKGFALDVLFTYSYGNDVYNAVRAEFESMKGFENQLLSTTNRWQYNGQVTDMPRAEFGDPNGNARPSDRWVEDGSYLRLKTVTLSYEIPVKTGFLRNAQVFVSGNNLLTFTKYLGYDPEVSGSIYSIGQGIDLGYTPVYKSVFAGLKIGL